MVLNTLLATQPYDFWRDSIWQFIGAAIAVILGVPAIFLAVMSFRQQSPKKEISYGVISDVSIANISRVHTSPDSGVSSLPARLRSFVYPLETKGRGRWNPYVYVWSAFSSGFCPKTP